MTMPELDRFIDLLIRVAFVVLISGVILGMISLTVLGLIQAVKCIQEELKPKQSNSKKGGW